MEYGVIFNCTLKYVLTSGTQKLGGGRKEQFKKSMHPNVGKSQADVHKCKLRNLKLSSVVWTSTICGVQNVF